jgi:hypothetical protein
MSQTTGPVLALGAITTANRSIFHDKPIDWRPLVATGLAAVAFTAAERMWPAGARMLAWTAVIAVCLTRVEADVPSPVESALAWWDGSATPSKPKVAAPSRSV